MGPRQGTGWPLLALSGGGSLGITGANWDQGGIRGVPRVALAIIPIVITRSDGNGRWCTADEFAVNRPPLADQLC
jgi:hypothetical protein